MATTSSNTELREAQFLKAELADEAGRHDHTVRFMMEIAKSVTPLAELSLPERKFLRSAIKKFLDDHRQAWYEVNSTTFRWIGNQSAFAKFYLNRIAEEILNVCKEMILLINRRLIRSARSAESRVFYLTFKGDVSSYITEFLRKKGEEDHMAAILAYREAKAIAKAELTWLSPARLMLALSMSEFYTEILEFPDKGARVARKALKNALEAGGNLTEGELDKEMKELLSKLRDYLAFWTNNEDEEEEEEEEVGTQLVAGTSLVQEALPSEIAEKAGTSGAAQPFLEPKPAADEAETSMARASLQLQPGEEPRISETPVTPTAEFGLKTGVSETLSMSPSPAL